MLVIIFKEICLDGMDVAMCHAPAHNIHTHVDTDVIHHHRIWFFSFMFRDERFELELISRMAWHIIRAPHSLLVSPWYDGGDEQSTQRAWRCVRLHAQEARILGRRVGSRAVADTSASEDIPRDTRKIYTSEPSPPKKKIYIIMYS